MSFVGYGPPLGTHGNGAVRTPVLRQDRAQEPRCQHWMTLLALFRYDWRQVRQCVVAMFDTHGWLLFGFMGRVWHSWARWAISGRQLKTR